MSGYLIFPEEVCDWGGHNPSKIKPHPIRLGLFDLIREFEQDPFPFDRRSPGVCLHGLDKLLAHLDILEGLTEPLTDKHVRFLAEIHKRLVAVANEVSNMAVIHVPVCYPLDLGASNQLYAKYAGKRIPLWRLFGCHPTIGSEASHATYLFGENLS